MIEPMSAFFRMAVVAAALSFAAPPVVQAKAKSGPVLEGVWDTPAGRMELKQRGDKTGGVLMSAIDGVDIKTPQLMLQGTFYEDNVTAEVRLGLVAPECGDTDKQAFVMLLLTNSGKLTGGVSTKEACASGVSSITFFRAKNQTDEVAARSDEGKASATALSKAQVDAALHAAFDQMRAGRFEVARRLFIDIIADAPSRGEAYNGVGVTHAMRSDWREAIAWYKKGLEAQPAFGDLYYNLACAYSQMGKTKMALRYLKLSALNGYTDLEPMENDPDLKAVRASEGYVEIRALMDPFSAELP